MPLKSFLNAVLPNEGVKCWVEISKSKAATQGFVPTIEELAAKLLEIDSRGVDAYFGCAALVTDRSRRAGNVLGAKAFWIDIDVGESTPERPKYATIQDAIQACDEFCNRVPLELPGMVMSGSGIHAYWTFSRTIAPADWLFIAQKLKLLTAVHGFHVDPSRTADIASILRPPGTKNYKFSNEATGAERYASPSARSVTIVDDLDLFSPIAFEDFSATIIKNTEGLQPQKINPPLMAATPNANLAAGLSTGKAFNPNVGVAAGSRGSTRIRYAGELVAKGFSADDVLAKLVAWDLLCTPPEGEAACIHSMKSAFSMHAARHPAPALMAAPLQDAPPEQLPALPYGFKWGNAGQLLAEVTEEDAGGNEVKSLKIVSQLPVYMAAWMNEEGQKQKNSYLFKQYHPAKGFQELIVNCRDFNGQNWYGLWTENGGSIIDGSDKLFKTYARRHENMLRLPGKELTRYSQFGWKDDSSAFLVGSRLCHADGRVEKAYGTDKLAPLMEVMCPAPKGSLQAWTHAANKLGMPTMEPHLTMVLASMAAPLLKFCIGDIDGGAIMSFVSEESGMGKSPMATACASVWGKLAASIDTGNFTTNRRIEDLVRHCHLPLIEEEMPYSDPQIAADDVKKFTSGSDRGRLTRTGAASGIPERYQTMLLSISNKSLYQLVKMVDIPMSRRVFEINVERPDKELISNLGGITREMVRNCGHAGLQLGRLMVEPTHLQYIRECLDTNTETGKVGRTVLKYRQLLNSEAEHRYIVWPLACIDTIARIVTHHHLIDFDVERVMGWIADQAAELMRDRAANVVDAATTKLIKFIKEHAEQCLTVAGPFQAHKGAQLPLRLPRGILAMRLELSPARMCITNDALQKWCASNGVNFIQLGKKLAEAKIVTARSMYCTLVAGTDIAGGRELCMEVDMAHPAINGQMRELEKCIPGVVLTA